MNADYTMDDTCAIDTKQYAQQISTSEYNRQAVEFTTQEVERLNAAVRAQPKLGARSEFFQDEENVVKGLPVFQGKHIRFLYDEEEIVAAVDVTLEALNNGPVVRTVAELDENVDNEEEEEYDEDYNEEQDHDDVVRNTFYRKDKESDIDMSNEHIHTLVQDVEMELASLAFHEQDQLSPRRSKR
ncbi:uncharacterized protein PHALS_13914 [Plasmopara halstedii]|uniref:Uncharacterized protein n=1 Tax=Plasmopara halstedii TaxID=4781 RepID=A0A0P1A5A2_PLAHL|nr:uncharacterized protein PHALS_13914 [Plasmopara halstedii]CEG35161.1 hypothetical protein PHALS_13914 [Plasmopara halstedii]|eukprot:XP_024571530.1 hypothetical protein PHALS_13914 [Plasmopara halstedii]